MAVVPSVPDAERRTRYTLSSETGPKNVSFDIYGNGTDYADWIEVWLNGVKLTAVTDWTLDSPSGSLAALERPITDARITLTASRSGTLDIVGADKPQRTTQLTQGVGETAREKNQTYSHLVVRARELFDKFARAVIAPPGETMAILSTAATRASKYAKFDASGNLVEGGAESDIEAGAVAGAASAAEAAASATAASGSASSASTSAGNASTSASNASTSASAAANSATAAAAAAGALAFKFTWSTNTSASDPTSGKIKVNNASPASATALYISETDANANGIASEIARWDDATNASGKARIKIAKNATNFLLLTITSSVTDNGAWDTFTVSNGVMVGSIADGDTVYVVTMTSGSDGSGTISGSTGATDNRILRADGTGGATVQSSAVLLDDSGNMSGVGALSATTIEVGNASDTTISRSAAGVIAVEGNTVKLAGKETVWIPASAMVSRTTNGPSTGTVETTTNKIMLKTLDFDTTTQEYAQFQVRMPKSWNVSTVTFTPVWSHAATTTDFGVVWGLEAVSLSDNEAADTAVGTAQTSTDTGGTTNNIYIGPESAAITIGSSPAAQDYVVFQVKRLPALGTDTLAIDARLHGVTLNFTTNAATDA